MRSKTSILILIGTAAGLLVISPATSFAVPASYRPSDLLERKATPKNTPPFCLNLMENGSKIRKQFESSKDTLKKEHASQIEKRTDKRQDKEQELKTKYTDIDQKRAAQFTKLEEAAQTPAQMEAVRLFKAAVTTATTAHRKAIADANATLKKGLDQLATDQKAAVEKTISTRDEGLTTALSKAKADCDAGVDATEVRATLLASLKENQSDAKSARKALEPLTMQRQALIDAHRKSIAEAHAAFKASLETARTNLKATLKQATPSASPTAN